MKNIYSPLTIVSSFIIFLFVSVNYSYAQTLQAGAADEGTAVATSTVDTWEDVAEVTLSVVGANKVMVIANFETDVTSGNSDMTATYRLTDGVSASAIITRWIVAKSYNDYGLGTVVHIFSYSSITASKTFKLQHKRPESGANKVFSSKANMVAIVLDDTNNSLPNSVKSTADITTTSTSYVQVTGSKTDAIVLTKLGGIYISAAFSTHASTGTLTGSWVLRSSTDGTNFSEVSGASMSRTNSTDVGAATGTWLFEDQPAGTYYFDVAHKTDVGELHTKNLTLIAIGLTDANGNVFPTFKSTSGSASTTSATAVTASSTSAIVSENAANSLFAHATFSMSSSAIIAAPEFSLGITTATFSPISFMRYIPAGGTGSGGLVGLGTSIALNGLPVVSLNHKSDGSNSLSTSNINLVGFQLKSSPTLVWNGATSNDWNTTTNWTPSVVPTTSHDVSIASGTPIIGTTTAADVNDINISGGTLTISSNTSNNGSLIIAGTPTGNITYNRYMVTNQWHMLGSPLTGQELYADFLAIGANSIVESGGNYNMKHYVENPEAWSPLYTSASTDDFALAQGYATMRSASGVVSLTGTPNTVTQTVGLTRGAYGWNLLSNPFTSAIAANSTGDATNNLLSINSSVMDPNFTALYIWDASSYIIINHTPGQNHLQVGQGFFVRAEDGTSDNFSITPAMQSHQTSIAFKASEESIWASILLISETNGDKASTQILYEENMSRGLDIGYDAGSFGSKSFSLYSRLIEDNGVDFAIQCLPTDYEELVVPIGLEAKAGDLVSFSAEALNIPEEYVVVLEDRKLDVFTNLSEDGTKYTIQLTDDSDGVGRFFVHTVIQSALGLDDLETENIFQVFTRPINHQLIIRGEANSNTVARIYSITGKLLTTVNLLQATENTIQFNEEAGVYIVQIVDKNGTFTQKFAWVK